MFVPFPDQRRLVEKKKKEKKKEEPKERRKKNNNRKKEDYLTKVSTSPRSPKPVSGIFDFLHASQEEIDSNDDASLRFKVRLEKRIPGEKNVLGR